MDDFIEQINELKRTSFTVSSIPVKTLKKFKEFCESDCNNNYATGIGFLLNLKGQWDNLVPLLSSILREVEGLKKGGEQPKKQLKTFGDN